MPPPDLVSWHALGWWHTRVPKRGNNGTDVLGLVGVRMKLLSVTGGPLALPGLTGTSALQARTKQGLLDPFLAEEMGGKGWAHPCMGFCAAYSSPTRCRPHCSLASTGWKGRGRAGMVAAKQGLLASPGTSAGKQPKSSLRLFSCQPRRGPRQMAAAAALELWLAGESPSTLSPWLAEPSLLLFSVFGEGTGRGLPEGQLCR